MNSVNAGLAILHIVTGLFFTVTGARKVFLPAVQKQVFGLLADNRVPVPARYAAIWAELLGGLALLFGFLTQLAAGGLVFVMIGAYVMGAWPGVRFKNPGSIRTILSVPGLASRLVSNALCTPEAQLLVIVATLAFTGAGSFSLDHLLFN